LLFSEKYVDLCAKIELKILEFSYCSNLCCMGLLEKKFRSGVFHVPVCYFLIKITSLYINQEKLSGKSIYLSIYMYICTYICYFPCLLPPTQERAFTLYYIIFLKGPPQLFSLPGQLFFFRSKPWMWQEKEVADRFISF